MEKKQASTVVNDFLTIAHKHDLQDNVQVHGSVGYGVELTPFWSDIDASIIIPRATAKFLRSIEQMRSEYMSKHPDIPLSLTVIEEDDTVSNNYFHHHGVKPMSYNLELAKQSETIIPFRYNQHVLRASSVYRYYEILFTFRRDVIANTKFSFNVVARGYHRLSRLLRTQIEILYPEVVLEVGKIHERKFIDMFHNNTVIDEFYERFDYVKHNWDTIRLDESELQRQGEYLVETFWRVHEEFLPRLQALGGMYNAHYS